MLCVRLNRAILSHISYERLVLKLSTLQVNQFVVKRCYSDMQDVSKLSKYSYWKETYARKHGNKMSFDWFVDANDVREQLTTELIRLKEGCQSHINVLDIGCGTSSLPFYMYKEIQTPVSLFCADFITDALRIQKGWLADTSPGHSSSVASFVTCNACSIPFLSNMFHMVIDKGTMDSLLKSSTGGKSKAEVMMSEVYRILCSGGKYLQITDEDPDVRLALLEDLSKKLPHEVSWSFITIDCNNYKEYFMFQFTKLI
ncbi:citrate synthase-lysine N-methyltransferase CSKMT, mitochondrial-like [Gigantopelta aegis]|uniref:citrate synthase-lysine N-methyltransferase CSKMT, mitochondrial-like n=1 Tax=Gigantopelta aegis TaxID=1735272 RepID=UPI001B88D82E|nr:citrate synthase-lysine N-methyltransferase CSKMT, mitochondrial-like [Gigantopelta aegis]